MPFYAKIFLIILAIAMYAFSYILWRVVDKDKETEVRDKDDVLLMLLARTLSIVCLAGGLVILLTVLLLLLG